MGSLEYELIAGAIFKAATGGDIGNTTRLRDVHAAMLRIMSALSSYTVQYIQQINDSPIKIIDGKFPKLTIPKELTEQTTLIETPAPGILDIDAFEKSTIKTPVTVVKIGMNVSDQVTRQKIPVDVGIRLVGIGTKSHPIEVQVPKILLRRPEVLDLSTLEQKDIAGYEPIPSVDISGYITSGTLAGYEGLTEARRSNLLSI